MANVKFTLEYINILTKFRIDLWQECDEMFITCCDFYGQIFRCSERKSLVFEMRRKMFVPHSEPIFLLFFFLFFLFHFLRENMFPKNSVLSGNELILLYMVNIDANTFSFIHIYLMFRVEHQKIFFFIERIIIVSSSENCNQFKCGMFYIICCLLLVLFNARLNIVNTY